MPNNRTITFAEAIRESLEQLLETDERVYVIGEGVPDPKAIFDTTKGLQEKFGENRVMDMPVAENGMTGIIIGSAVTGMRPVLIHQRIDFSIYALDQVINNAAKWYSMFGGQNSCPLVIRLIIGKGWGQGNQHSQNLQSLYSHIPGLKVVMPSNAYDAKGMLIAAVRDNNPVIFIEHRWLHNTTSLVPSEMYEVEIGKSQVVKAGADITIVSWSYMMLEAIKAAEYLEKDGLSVELVDIKSLSPLDFETIKKSLQKTGRLLVVDAAWKHGGFAGEILARVAEDNEIDLKTNSKRITFPDFPSPSTPGLCQFYYANFEDIYTRAHDMTNLKKQTHLDEVKSYITKRVHDVPDQNFKGPF